MITEFGRPHQVQDGEAGLARLMGGGSGPKLLKVKGANAEGVWNHEVEREPVAPGGGVVEVVTEEHEGLKRTYITTKKGLDKR